MSTSLVKFGRRVCSPTLPPTVVFTSSDPQYCHKDSYRRAVISMDSDSSSDLSLTARLQVRVEDLGDKPPHGQDKKPSTVSQPPVLSPVEHSTACAHSAECNDADATDPSPPPSLTHPTVLPPQSDDASDLRADNERLLDLDSSSSTPTERSWDIPTSLTGVTDDVEHSTSTRRYTIDELPHIPTDAATSKGVHAATHASKSSPPSMRLSAGSESSQTKASPSLVPQRPDTHQLDVLSNEHTTMFPTNSPSYAAVPEHLGSPAPRQFHASTGPSTLQHEPPRNPTTLDKVRAPLPGRSTTSLLATDSETTPPTPWRLYNNWSRTSVDRSL
ncbi:hypothetical protein GY45DRAFT_943925 [Cubamyces sp. BRFM 1775]|nr:hypothetical protein GY45DRAFT_943925 [Cubamyces sp. BRFM 1775]